MSNSIDVIRAGLQTPDEFDPHVTGKFHLETEIANGVDLSIYMVNDFGEILINDNGTLLKE
jgi:hypothetical protein